MKTLKVKTLASLVTLVAAGGLTGCAATKEAIQTYDKDSKKTISMIEGAKPVSAVASADSSQEKMANFGRVKKNWVNPNPLPKHNPNLERTRLPEFFQKNISLTVPGKESVIEIMTELQRSKVVKVTFNQDVYDTAGGSASVISGNGGGGSARSGAGTPVSVNDFVFRGTLESALDLIAAKANISWRWTGAEVEFYRFETRSYNISLLAGTTTANSSVNLQSDSTSGSSSADNTNTEEGQSGIKNNSGGEQAGTATSNGTSGVSRTANLDSWGDVRSYLVSLMTSQGSIAIMETTGLVTIKDTPQSQKKVAEAIKSLNALIGQQIYINVDVYSVTKDASDDYGLDLNLAWAASGNNIRYVTASGSAATNKMNIGIANGPFAGSGVVLQALSKLGKTSIVNQFEITALNGQPTPIGNNRKIPYISGIQIQSDQQGNPVQSVTTGAIFQGISMNLTPKIQPNGKVLLEYSMNLSDFQGFTRFDTGSGANSQSLNLPTTTLKNILQRASLRSGQPLILSGFKQSVATDNGNGVGSPNNFLLGGGRATNKQDQYLVIIVTPYVAQDNE
jgi:type IVB pilus formation R64 PilN family outer membrane protein